MSKKHMWALLFEVLIIVRPLTASVCTSLDPFLQNDLATALTWATLHLPCSDVHKQQRTNQSLEELPTDENVSSKILSRKRRFYMARDPTMTCELRYVLPLFPISEELFTYANIELPVGLDMSYPLLENNAAARKMPEESSSIFEGLENLIAGIGIDGKSCVLRAICDVASIAPVKPRGILRDAMEVAVRHMLKGSQSSSKRSDSSSSSSYLGAAAAGKSGLSCAEEYPSCPISFLSLVDFGLKE